MSRFLDYVSLHRGGAAIVLLIALGLVLALQWIAWIFQFGRFKANITPRRPPNQLRYIVADFFVRLINDFRHLLALCIVMLFAVALAAAMYPGFRRWDVQQMAAGLQAVAAALGGLMGSIIGYYFGESAAAQRTPSRAVRDAAPVQAPPDSLSSDISQAPKPPPERIQKPDADKP